MPGAIVKEVRLRVVEAYNDGGGTYQEIAERFKVGRASVSRWLALERRTGTVDAKPTGGARHPLIVDAAGAAFLLELVEAIPDSTLGEMVLAYEDQFGVRMGQRTMGRAVARLGLTRKRGV